MNAFWDDALWGLAKEHGISDPETLGRPAVIRKLLALTTDG